MTAAELIAAFSVRFDPAMVSPELRQRCARSLLDTYAVGVAGRSEPAALRARAYLATLGAGEQAALWGQEERAPVESAALYNGIAAHVLDYDDVTSPLRGHPSVVLWPALLALGECEGLPMRRLMSAYVVGFEVICKLARAIAVEHYARGWHATASIGVIGAAAACAHLLSLTATQTAHAVGLAVAQAAGTRANFGADAKSFQAGQANAAAVRAARLAQAGFTASPDSMGNAQGYSVLYGQGQDLAPALECLGQAPLELIASGIDVKKYPLCYATHRTLDALLALRADHGLTLESVDRVEIETSPGALVPLIHHRPATGLQGKFSMEYAVAAALADGRINLASFTDEQVRRPGIQAFLPRVHAECAAGAGILPRWASVRIHERGGACHVRRVEDLRGSSALPLSDQELMDKAADCYAWARMRADVPKQLSLAGEPDAVVADFLALVRPA